MSGYRLPTPRAWDIQVFAGVVKINALCLDRGVIVGDSGNGFGGSQASETGCPSFSGVNDTASECSLVEVALSLPRCLSSRPWRQRWRGWLRFFLGIRNHGCESSVAVAGTVSPTGSGMAHLGKRSRCSLVLKSSHRLRRIIRRLDRMLKCAWTTRAIHIPRIEKMETYGINVVS